MLDTHRMKLISGARHNKIWQVVQGGNIRLPTEVDVTLRGVDEMEEIQLEAMSDVMLRGRELGQDHEV